jgi:hypothetical protein
VNVEELTFRNKVLFFAESLIEVHRGAKVRDLFSQRNAKSMRGLGVLDDTYRKTFDEPIRKARLSEKAISLLRAEGFDI